MRRWVPAVLLAGAGVVTGWLLISGLLALPLPEGALFALSGVSAAAFLGAAMWVNRLVFRAFAIGGFIGAAGSLLLVLLLVVG
jgi:hypothetical protein